MNTFPFNEAGLQKLLAELHQLPDEVLESQAKALQHDYRTWVNSHYQPTATQVNFLQRIDDRFINRASTLTHSFLTRRLTINLVKAENTSLAESKDGEGKLIDLGKKTNAAHSEDGSFIESESLIYTISYKANE